MTGLPLKVIKTKDQYHQYMSEFMSLFGKNLDDDQDKKDRYELLGVLIQDYEKREYPSEKPSAIDAILFEMDQRKLSKSDMTVYLGHPSKVSEVLSGKRNLSITMIIKLHYELGIPLDILIQKPEDIDVSDEVLQAQSEIKLNKNRDRAGKLDDKSEW